MKTKMEISDKSWQAAKDIIVESVISGIFKKKYEVAKNDFEYGLEERDQPNHDESIVGRGAWITDGAVPDKFDLDEFDNCLDWSEEERANAIENGAAPTREEFIVILGIWLSNICEFQESNDFSSFGVFPLVHSNGEQCLFICTVSGFSMSYSEYVEGYFLDVGSAFAHLRKHGLICADIGDYDAVVKFIERCLPAG